MVPLLRFSTLRILLLLGALLVLHLLGLRGVALVLVAALVSMLASLVLLRRQRADLSATVSRGVDRRLRRAGAQDAEVEDAEVDGRP